MQSTGNDSILRTPGARRDAVFTVLTFAVLLFAPLAMVGLGLGRDEQIMREWEYRRPSPRPPLPTSKEEIAAFPWQWDAYWNDVFPFRSPLIHLHAFVRYRLLGANSLHKLFLREGFVFDVRDIDKYRGKQALRDEEVDAFLRILGAKREFFRKAGIAYYFVLSPSRLDFHRDVVPAEFNLPDRNVWSEQIRARLSPVAREYFIMPDEAMHAAQARWPERPLYYRRDGHWNQWGRTVAAAAIVRFMQKDFPALPALDPSEVPFVHAPEDQTFWGAVRMLGLSFDDLPPVRTVKIAPEWAERCRQLAADRDRNPLVLAYTSDSFMEILSDCPPEIMSFGRVVWLGLSQFDRLNSPANCAPALDVRPDIVLEGKALAALDFADYLRKNAAWLAADSAPRPAAAATAPQRVQLAP
jgi:hypothetical protein